MIDRDSLNARASEAVTLDCVNISDIDLARSLEVVDMGMCLGGVNEGLSVSGTTAIQSAWPGIVSTIVCKHLKESNAMPESTCGLHKGRKFLDSATKA